MTITLQPEIAYTLLSQIRENSSEGAPTQPLKSAVEGTLGHAISEKDFLGHLDYMNQKGYLDATFAGDAYADEGPNPLPSPVALERARLTESGLSLLQRLEQEYQDRGSEPQQPAIAPENMAFLERIMTQAGLPDIFDARDITEVVFRTMRDMMSHDAAQQVAAELHQRASDTRSDEIREEVADLWLDTNPIVSLISQLRPPLNIDADLFLRRIRQEGAVPKHIETEQVLTAIFSATKAELSPERKAEVGRCLPGQIQQLWQAA